MCRTQTTVPRPQSGVLIKATQPIERHSIVFKGPLPTTSCSTYLLTVLVDTHVFLSCFLVPICSHQPSSNVLVSYSPSAECLVNIHSYRGASFLSEELKQYLAKRGIATSKTTPYQPIGNGQVEHYNSIIWFVDQVPLIDVNPTYTHVEYPDGRESSVSLRDLAPCPLSPVYNEQQETLPSSGERNQSTSALTSSELQQDYQTPSTTTTSIDQQPSMAHAVSLFQDFPSRSLLPETCDICLWKLSSAVCEKPAGLV